MQFTSPHVATPKISENSWKRDVVRWWTLNGHIFKKVERTFFPGTPVARKSQAIYSYNLRGQLTRRSISGLFDERVVEHHPPGKQFGRTKLVKQRSMWDEH